MRLLQQRISHNGFGLTPLALDDRQLYIQLFTDPDVMRLIAPPLSEGKASFLFQRALNNEICSTYYYWVVRNSDGDKVGLAAFILQPEKVAEFGLMLLPEFCFKGYSVPILSGLINFGFRQWQLDKVFAKHQSNNLAASGLLKRLKMFRVSGKGDYWFWQLEQNRWAELNLQPPFSAENSN